MHGGHQNRPVRLESNSDLFSALALSCNRLHKHATDAMQHPSDRGAYPWLLCHRIADLLSLQAPSRDMQPSLLGPATSMLRLALDRQGRYRKPLVSEFRHYDAWAFTPDSDADRSKVLQLYPKGARIVRRKLCKGGGVVVCRSPMLSGLLPASFTQEWVVGSGVTAVPSSGEVVEICGIRKMILDDQVVEVSWVGVPRDPLDFLQEAVKAGHPKSFLDQDEPSLELLVDNLLGESSCEGSSNLLDEWESRRSDLAMFEEGLRLGWPRHVQDILEGKQTELLKRLLCEHGYPDSKVVDHMREGFKLSGWMFKTGVYPLEARPPSVTMERQLATARSRNLSTLAKLRSQPSDEVTARAWGETKAEVDRGSAARISVLKRHPNREAQLVTSLLVWE